MPKPSVSTTGGPGGPSPRVLQQVLTPSLLGVWSEHRFPLQPWHCVTLTTSLCHQTSQWLCSPEHMGLHLWVEIIPALSLCAWDAAKPHPDTCTGILQSWAHLSQLSPAAAHPLPCPRVPDMEWASHHLKDGFFCGNITFLYLAPLPTVDEVGWGLQQPLIWAPP